MRGQPYCVSKDGLGCCRANAIYVLQRVLNPLLVWDFYPSDTSCLNMEGDPSLYNLRAPPPALSKYSMYCNDGHIPGGSQIKPLSAHNNSPPANPGDTSLKVRGFPFAVTQMTQDGSGVAF